jgi:RimJ/RimL family protein N-acetyltransferase
MGEHEQFAVSEAAGNGGAVECIARCIADLRKSQSDAVKVEETVVLKGNRFALLRLAKADDAEGVRELFCHLPTEDVYTRFFRHVHGLSKREVQRLCNFDSRHQTAFIALVDAGEDGQVVAYASYFVNPATNLAETAFMVHPHWQGNGLGAALQQRLVEHAKSHGVRGFVAELMPENTKMVKLAQRCCDYVCVECDEDTVHVTMLF